MEQLRFPVTQRRLRQTALTRELQTPLRLSHRSFICPVFVEEGLPQPRSITGMGEVQVATAGSVIWQMEEALAQGISKFLLFPVPAHKRTDDFDFGFAASVVRRIREHFGPSVWLAADLCLCSYTSHGHCGILNQDHTQLLNNETVDRLSRYALVLAQAGADCIAPSDMTDGRIGAIRSHLNALGYEWVSIMSYSAKFSSQWYGPFRDACHSAPNSTGLQNRKSYQLSPWSSREAIAAGLRDEAEGADILMVKPAMLYTDLLAALRQQCHKPLAAYHVSGEYAAIELMAQQGLIDREAAHLEVWAALQRSGADIIISYAAPQAKLWIENWQA